MNEIVLTQRLKDDFEAMPESVQKKLKKQIRFLAENPKHQSLQIHRIQGTAYWEFYIGQVISLYFSTRRVNFLFVSSRAS